ncbi:uncharacterized protein LOC116014846 [Ipomoea triloba]|uniref:uncharacterized protein LOC116014846 n=1 Tax=Ipomoea triloba TaxID=35885 RepID=UPI00125CF7AB|nr:uncharacterized protein LOC116014846 [Ipomoea triloba]
MSVNRRRSNGGGENRFYCPPAMRRQQQQMQAAAKSKSDKRTADSDDGASSTSTATTTTTTPSTTASFSTNLDRFLEYTTPKVPAQLLSKTSMKSLRNHGGDLGPYFILDDLWESFKEWSAYGAGVPLVLNESDSVVQYYVPYLSGIQLYIDPARHIVGPRRPGEESDGDSYRETSSDDGSEYVAGRGANSIKGKQNQQNLMNATANGFNKLSLRNDGFMESLADENETSNPPGLLIFEFLEQNPPQNRQPLTDKISSLASQFPDLKTYRSCDLAPSSWISVAWYPIYRIPIGPTLQSLDACFLTFHSLSTQAESSTRNDLLHNHGSSTTRGMHDNGMPMKLSLPSFGLASYKFKVSFWFPSETYESQRVNSLLREADRWLRLLQVNHPDYRFFLSRNTYFR